MSCGIFLFAVVSTIAKIVSTKYPANEIIFFRMLFGIIPAALMFRFCNIPKKAFTLHRFWEHFLRAVLALGSMGLFFSGLPHLPLSAAVTLHYTEAIFIALLAVMFLGERLRVPMVIALVAGSVGVALIASFSSDENTSLLGVGLVLLSAVFNAGSVIQIKKLSRTEESAVIVLYFTIIATIFSGCSLWVSWTAPNMTDLGYMGLLGLTAGTGQLMLTIAFRNAAASMLAPFSYFGIVWAIILEYLIWGEVVSMQAIVGSIVIIGSAFYLSMSGKSRVNEAA
ncbi:membrane protein [bacterium endosymbiont of Mortierella elongata FMR23-6]|nr:membrane protein [bacterium endosymbiont of Mortierella elongata FMR23-6]